MQTALVRKTKIRAGGKVELTDPQLLQLPVDEEVEVIVVFPSTDKASATVERRSILDIIAELPEKRLFSTAEEVKAYLDEEHDAWDN